jgi:hypothetical protein
MSHFSDNDDDLFQEPSPQTQSPSFHNVFSNSTFTKDEELESLIESTKDYAKNKGVGSGGFMLRTGIITSFYEVTNRFVFETDSLSRSIFNALNTLSDGKYSKDLYADTLEESIAKRFSIIEFLNAIMQADNTKSFELAAKHLNITLDDSFIRVYFGSMHKILNHAINRNIDIYQKLCEQINRVPMKAIVDRDYSNLDVRSFSSNAYINQSFQSIRESLGFKVY